jgi:hypothetical protein
MDVSAFRLDLVLDLQNGIEKDGFTMPPISRDRQFIRALATRPGSPSTPAKSTNWTSKALQVCLDTMYPNSDWTPDRVKEWADRFSLDPAIPVSLVNGRSLSYYGTETGAEPALYRDVKSGLESKSRPEAFGSHPEVFLTPGKKGHGPWTNPDIVVRRKLKSTAKKTMHVHSLEVEQPNGFCIQSVYQAYEQGRGADFAWVFYSGLRRVELISRRYEVSGNDVEMRRILVAAKELGVGLVHVQSPTVPSGWKVILEARERDVAESARAEFENRCPGAFLELLEAE